jgi:hypothetical protein
MSHVPCEERAVHGDRVVNRGGKGVFGRVPLGPWQLKKRTHSEMSSNYLCTNCG